MSKRALNTLAGLFAIPFAILLIALVLPASWAIVVGNDDPSGWGAIGMYFWIAVGCGLLSAFFQWAANRVGDRAQPAAQPAHPGTSRERALYFSALKSGIIDGDAHSRLRGADLGPTDGMLHSYADRDIDWRALWAAASSRFGSIPPYAEDPFWTTHGPDARWIPVTVLAFWGIDDRLRIARDGATEEFILETLAEDPSARVRAAAEAQL